MTAIDFSGVPPVKDDQGRWALASSSPAKANKAKFLAWANEVVTGWGNEQLNTAEQNLVWRAYQQGQADTAGHLLFNVVAQARPGAAARTGTGMKQGSDKDTKAALEAVQDPGGHRVGMVPTAATPGAGAAPAPVSPNATAADVNAAVKKSNLDPTAQSFIDKALANYAPSNVTYWSGLGIDPDAKILGVTRYKPYPGVKPGISNIYNFDTTAAQSADKWLGGLYKMAPDDLLALQRRLWDGGWYIGTNGANGKPITSFDQLSHGRPDPATLQAYGGVLAETARYNHAGQQINIDGVIGMGSPGKNQGGPGTGSPYQTTAPADLASAYKAQSVQMTGREQPEGQAQFEQQYLAEEDAARRQAVSAGALNQTVPIGGPGTPGNEAEQYIDTHHLADKIAYGAAVRQQSFFNLLRSPV